MQSLTFKFNKPLSILVIFVLPVLAKLGFWQLERADEKEKILSSVAKVKKLPITNWQAMGLESGQLVKISGHFTDKEYWLLDNRIHRGQVGFEILMPFVSNNEVILVNRGWVKGDLSRRKLPEVETPSDEVLLTGRIHRNIKNSLVEYISTEGWPKIISAVEPAQMYQELEVDTAGRNTAGHNTVDSVVRLQGDSQGALITDWPAVNVRPEKHTAYAVQWFAMALALLIMYIVYSSNILSLVFNDAKNEKIR